LWSDIVVVDSNLFTQQPAPTTEAQYRSAARFSLLRLFKAIEREPRKVNSGRPPVRGPGVPSKAAIRQSGFHFSPETPRMKNLSLFILRQIYGLKYKHRRGLILNL
jgi:hypothetical protein